MEVSKQKLCSLLRVEEKAEGVGAVDQSIRASDREGLEAQSATAEGGGSGQPTEARQRRRWPAVETGEGWGADRQARGYSTPV
jgi:hypothetical protein